MTDPTPDRPELLPCGADPLDVDDRARSGRSTAHERSCAFCQGAVTANAPAGRAATALVAAERDTAAPDTLLPGVMRTVWSELRRASAIPLLIDAGAATAFIADHAVAALIESALDGVEGLQVHTCTVTVEAAADDPPVTHHDPRMVVGVSAAAAYVSDVAGLAARARDLVRRTVHEQLGWTVDIIDIDIVDVFVPEGPGT